MATLNTPYAILAFPSLFQPRPKFGDRQTSSIRRP